MKFLNIFLAALFAIFAWFQRNDIDPEVYTRPCSLDALLWLLFYLVIGTAFLILITRALPKWYFVLAVLACVIEMGLSGPGLWQNFFGEQPFTMTQVSMSAEDPRVELTREFFGALIALAAVAFQFWQSKRLRKSA